MARRWEIRWLHDPEPTWDISMGTTLKQVHNEGRKWAAEEGYEIRSLKPGKTRKFKQAPTEQERETHDE